MEVNYSTYMTKEKFINDDLTPKEMSRQGKFMERYKIEKKDSYEKIKAGRGYRRITV